LRYDGVVPLLCFFKFCVFQLVLQHVYVGKLYM
jgi:hypothetical protein